MARARICYLFIFVLFGALTAGLGQSGGTASDAEKLKLDRERFEYEKRQSTRSLIFGFVLTTVGGAYLTWIFSTRTWRRQTRIDLYQRRFDEGTAFLDTFSKMVGERYFLMQRFLWIVGDSDTKRAERLEKEYFKSVVAWNASYWVNRNKIRLLVSDEQANAFLDYQDDFRLEDPQSLHYLFVKAHRHVMKAKNGELTKAQAQMTMDSLNWGCSTYLESLTTSFLERVISLELLKTVPSRESSLKAAAEQRPGLSIPPRLWGQPRPTDEPRDRQEYIGENSTERPGR